MKSEEEDSQEESTDQDYQDVIESEPAKRSSGKRRRKSSKFRGSKFTTKDRKPRSTSQPKEATPSTSSSTSVSARKIGKISRKDLGEKVDHDWSGYIVMDFDLLVRNLQENCRCAKCGGQLEFYQQNERGWGVTIVQSCSECEVPISFNNSEKIGKKSNIYDINRRLVIAARGIGQGYHNVKKFCALLELPPLVSESSYYKISKTIHDGTEKVADVSMKRATREEIQLTSSCDVECSGDGTWQRRGFSSLNGVATLLGMKTGKVIVVEVLRKACRKCAMWVGDRTSTEFEEWYLDHIPDCEQNHYGSASKMESDGIVTIFKRSEEKYGMRYASYIGDGDSATHKCILDANPYPGVHVTKKECIRHVQKRIGGQLRRLRDSQKEPLEDGKGLKGKGRLTSHVIETIQSYYGNAVRENCQSVEGMKSAIWAIYYHLMSTDEEHNHNFCPKGKESWCKFQKAVAHGNAENYEHSKPLLDLVCLKATKPVFESLSKDELLERCIGAYSQNQNESFHNVIWNYSPKTVFVGRCTLETAVHLALLDYNEGQKSKLDVFEELGLKCGKRMLEWVIQEDSCRSRLADKRLTERSKEARKTRRRLLAAQEETHDEEGMLYHYGGF